MINGGGGDRFMELFKKIFISSNDDFPYTSKLEAISTQLISHGGGTVGEFRG